MGKATAQKKSSSNDSGLNFEAQLWAAAEQATPATHHKTTENNLGPRNADCFWADLHNRSRQSGTDFVPVRKDLANLPFNMSDWGGENLRQDLHWKFGMPPVINTNYA